MILQSLSPSSKAKQLLSKIGWSSPDDFTLEEIANYLSLDVRVENIGSEGRIVIKGDSGIITINAGINHCGKRNFVIAHEIGHFLLHKSLTPLFSDTMKTLSEWYSKGPQEQEANEFACELLMPEDIFITKIKTQRLSVQLIEEVSAYFKVSLLAAFLRYMRLGSYPLMIIYMESGIVKWKQCSNDFLFKYLPINSPVPAWTVAGDYFNRNIVEKKPEKVDAIEWFPEDFQIKYKKDWKLWEQCYRISETDLISCLWTY